MTSYRFACATATRRVLEVRGLRLSALTWPAPGRPPLCFLHGGSAHAHWFDLVARDFAGRFDVLSLDQRGHGESRWPDPPAYATEDFAADLLAVFDALGWDRVILAGHSMGGHNAMAFAAWHPERVRALVIIDARPAIPEERLGVMHRRGERGMRRYPSAEAAVAAFRLLPQETAAEPETLAHIAEAGIVARGGGWVYRFDPKTSALRRPRDNWALVGGIQAPTLVVRGERSPVLPPEMAARLCAGIREARLVEIPGAYHHLVLDRPDDFAAALDAFLKDVTDPTTA